MTPSYSSKIIKSEEATQKVTDYNAKKIIHDVPKQIHQSNNFTAEYTGASGSFRMDELLQERTGIGEKRQREVMEKVEESVIDKLKEVEQDAYRKAYELGMEEGRTEGLKNAESLVAAKLMSLDQVMTELADIRRTLVTENEAQIVRLSYVIASKIAIRDIEEDPSYIMDCVANLIDSMQAESKITLRVSHEDFDFIEEFKDRDLKTKDLFAKLKLYKEENLDHGECIFESNHGIINATMEGRLEKLWKTISENIPKTEAHPSMRAMEEEASEEENPIEDTEVESMNEELETSEDSSDDSSDVE